MAKKPALTPTVSPVDLSENAFHFNYVLANFGLNLSSKTGGSYYTGLEGSTLRAHNNEDMVQSTMSLANGSNMLFYHAKKFLKTVDHTEKSMQVKLFSFTN